MNNILSYCFKLLLCLSVVLLYSCEYDNKDMNYHEIKPPNEKVDVNINLAEFLKGQTVYIYSETNLQYTINASAGTILSTAFYLDNFQINSSNGSITLSPYGLNESGSSELRVKLKLSSGTGSLAELFGKETSDIEIFYPVKYVNPNVNLNINQRVNEQKQLELFWDKPTVEGVEIASYTVYNENDFNEVLLETITDPDQTSYVDKDYGYGSKTYRIVTKYKSDKIPQKEDYYTVTYESLTTDMFSTSSNKSFKLNIKWKNPNKVAVKYVLKWLDEVVHIQEGAHEGAVTRPNFPMQGSQYYELYILPLGAKFEDYSNYAKVVNYFQEDFFGELYSPSGGNLDFAADLKNNMILVMRPSDVSFGFRAYDKDDLTIKNIAYLNVLERFHTNKLLVAPNSGKIAIHHVNDRDRARSQIYVYSDYTMKKMLSIFPTDDFPIFFLTDDDKILISNNTRNLNRIYDVNTLETLNSQKDLDNLFSPAISSDGKYLINYLRIGKPWYRVYKYEDRKFTLLKQELQSEIKYVYFNPKTQNQVAMQTFGNSFTIYELPNMDKIATVKGTFICFDSFTGNLLYRDEHFESNATLHVLNATYDKLMYSIKAPSQYSDYSWLMNNHLILRDYYINIVK